MAAIPSILIANEEPESVGSEGCGHATWQAIQVATVTSICLVIDLRWICDDIASIMCLVDETLE